MTIRKEIVSSLMVILFGTGFLLYTRNYPLDSWESPGPGVFPLIVGGVLVALAGWQLVAALISHKLKKKPEGHRPPEACLGESGTEAKALYMIAVFILYLLMVQWIGYFVSTFVFVIACSRLIENKEWGKPLALSVGIIVFCYLLFEAWLKMSLPRGLLF